MNKNFAPIVIVIFYVFCLLSIPSLLSAAESNSTLMPQYLTEFVPAKQSELARLFE